jgi:hypothetical protein
VVRKAVSGQGLARLELASAGKSISVQSDVGGEILTTDPMDQFWNPYSYVGGDPLMGVDPDGLIDILGTTTCLDAPSDALTTWTSSVGPDGVMNIESHTPLSIAPPPTTGGPGSVANLDFLHEPGLEQDIGPALVAASIAGRIGVRVAQRAASSLATTVGMNGYRYMTEAELKAVQETGMLRGGRQGKTYFTKDLFKSGLKAQQRLSLPTIPTIRAEFQVQNEIRLLNNGTKVFPLPGLIGRGSEFMSADKVMVKLINWQKLAP